MQSPSRLPPLSLKQAGDLIVILDGERGMYSPFLSRLSSCAKSVCLLYRIKVSLLAEKIPNGPASQPRAAHQITRP